jgi:hypothetical protein
MDEIGQTGLPLDMSLGWQVTYVPESFSIQPTFVTDRRVWPL